MATAKNPPKSASSFALNLVALTCVVGALWALHEVPALMQLSNLARVSVVVLAIVVPVGLLDIVVLKVHRRASTGLDWDRAFDMDMRRVLTKLIGLAFTIGVVAFGFWVFPEYHGSFYDPFFNTLERAWAPLASVAILYTAWVDGMQKDPYDSYWQIGRFVLGHGEDCKKWDVANHARSWLVKAFFLPLMFTYFFNDVTRITRFDFTGATFMAPNMKLYDFLYDSVFLVDVAFCSLGYILALRVWDSHVRSAEPTMTGWVVALFCYMPFFSVFDRQYIPYGGPGFAGWLASYPTLKMLWACAIIALIVIYVLATVGFGFRFSNLTHRGILTNGTYRFTKHPAYVSKNLSWWMSSVPFVSMVNTGAEGKILCLRHCVMLLMLNTMYYLRARTEERHLSRDPVYVQYALWMNDHGMFAPLGRMFPFLRYKPPTELVAPPMDAPPELEGYLESDKGEKVAAE